MYGKTVKEELLILQRNLMKKMMQCPESEDGQNGPQKEKWKMKR